ncbi:hypothetical protein BJV77DRAFT_688632 [Russula vinacea]|nr:hypothetical protein BJV77DRAFT_688632 [Russula vinacea]
MRWLQYNRLSVPRSALGHLQCKGRRTFRAYAIASAKDLIPEMEFAAHSTLNHPMTFELLGEGLRLFEGRALRRLVNFRRRYRDIRPKIRWEYFMALQSHGFCIKCVAVHLENGSTFCAELENQLAQTRDKKSVRPRSVRLGPGWRNFGTVRNVQSS